jgi:hypothetical protein
MSAMFWSGRMKIPKDLKVAKYLRTCINVVASTQNRVRMETLKKDDPDSLWMDNEDCPPYMTQSLRR